MKVFKANRKSGYGRTCFRLSGLFTRAKAFLAPIYGAIHANSIANEEA